MRKRTSYMDTVDRLIMTGEEEQKHSVVTLQYEDLVSFDPLQPSQTLVDQIQAAYGSKGLGILAVQGVPDFVRLRENLLTLAPRIPTLPDLDTCINEKSLFSSGWSHGREQLGGEPDFYKGSYYANPLTEDLAQALVARDGRQDFWARQAEQHPSFYAPNLWPTHSLPALQTAFCQAGQTMTRVGCLVARVCDVYCQQQGVKTQFYEQLKESLNAKGRLLHYFDTTNNSAIGKDDNGEPSWCGWHNDHGSLTGLMPAMYLNLTGEQVTPPSKGGGLHIQARSGDIVRAMIPETCCAFQIGETSQIQSGGLLQATPHMVSSTATKGVTRESFAVFLEPEFHTPLEIPVGKSFSNVVDLQPQLPPSMVPLDRRWKPGQTFGDFHVATVSGFTKTD